MRLIHQFSQTLLALIMATHTAVNAQPSPAPQRGTWTVKDFRFHTGEALPELKLAYTTLGDPSGEPVLILHGTTGSGAGMLNPAFGGELFGPGNAQLPAPPMLMMDRITEISEDGGLHGKGHVVAEFDITPDLWFFECHFPGNPIMPGCLGLDGLWQLTGFNLGWRGWQGRGYALGVGEVKLTGMVRPDRKMLTYKVDFTKAIQTRRLTMGVANGIVEADGEVIYQVTDMKVALSAS